MNLLSIHFCNLFDVENMKWIVILFLVAIVAQVGGVIANLLAAPNWFIISCFDSILISANMCRHSSWQKPCGSNYSAFERKIWCETCEFTAIACKLRIHTRTIIIFGHLESIKKRQPNWKWNHFLSQYRTLAQRKLPSKPHALNNESSRL